VSSVLVTAVMMSNSDAAIDSAPGLVPSVNMDRSSGTESSRPMKSMSRCAP